MADRNVYRSWCIGGKYYVLKRKKLFWKFNWYVNTLDAFPTREHADLVCFYLNYPELYKKIVKNIYNEQILTPGEEIYIKDYL